MSTLSKIFKILRQTNSFLKMLIPFMKFILNINSTLKRHDMEKLYDNFPHRNIKLHTYSKSNTIKMNIYTINIKREDFPMHLMQHLSHNLRKKTLFS